MMDFIEKSRGSFGVEPICRTLQIAPSTYYDRRAIARDPERASRRAKSDAALSLKIDAAWENNRKLYGARKIWHVLRRDGENVARCTVERLMRGLGIKGVVRGKRVVTTNPDTSLPCPDDKVNRLFKADRPNKLWVSDFTYVPTWSGTVYVAFVIDVFARRIVGWRVSTSMTTKFVLDALDQAIWQSGKEKHLITKAWCITRTGAHKADSTGRRNTIDNIVFYQRVEGFRRCSPTKCFAGPCVQGMSDSAQFFGAMLAEVRPFGKVLPQQPVSVFVASTLPWALRVAEVDIEAGVYP